MASVLQRAEIEGQKAKVLPDDDDKDMKSLSGKDMDRRDKFEALVGWITEHTDAWRVDRETNYEADWDQYERLWRGVWKAEDASEGRERTEGRSRRSRFIMPALSEAVENCVSEVQEAVFGRGDYFDMTAEHLDAEELKDIVDKNKASLKEDLARTGFVIANAEALLSGAVFGDMIGEIVVKTMKWRDIVPVFDEQGQITGAEVVEEDRDLAELHAVSVRNFLKDPNSKTVDAGLGCAVEEYVGLHEIYAGQRSGDYFDDVEVGESSGDSTLVPDSLTKNEYVRGKAHVLRYYGLVPRNLLEAPLAENDDDVSKAIAENKEKMSETGMDTAPMKADLSDMVEAVVVIVNKKTCLKAIPNPFLMQDRPIVFAPWDMVPGRDRGRGVPEKGRTPQKLLDAEFRARVDALAFAGAPMMGLDASKLPRGFNLKVYPGRSVLTNGDPSMVMKPFQFGSVDANTWQQGQVLDQMIQRATGAVDAVNLAQGALSGQARTGAVGMGLAGIVKRNKRSLLNYIDRFFVPAITKIAWRNMQLNPERYIPFNFTFNASNTMGIMQREYESQTLAQVLGSMQPGSPEYSAILIGLLENTGLTNRAALVQMLKQSAQANIQAAQAQPPVDPMQEQFKQVMMQLAVAEAQAKTRKLNADAGLSEQKTITEQVEPQLRATALATKGIYDTPEGQMAAEFDRRLQIADRMLEAEDIQSNERITTMQMQTKMQSDNVSARAKVTAERIKALGAARKERAAGASKLLAAQTKAQGAVAVEQAAGQAAVATELAKPQPLPARSAKPTGGV